MILYKLIAKLIYRMVLNKICTRKNISDFFYYIGSILDPTHTLSNLTGTSKGPKNFTLWIRVGYESTFKN